MKAKEIIATFPKTFKLRAWPRLEFYIHEPSCFESDGKMQLYVYRLDTKEAFCKGTAEELRKQIV